MQKEQLELLKTWFDDHVSSFYNNDEFVNANIKLKEEHTRRVCDEMDGLTTELGLSENDRLIAETIALFHDVGRFEQFVRYRTYSDGDSANHCLLALEVLKKHNVLERVDKAERRIIETAIEFHGAIELPNDLAEDTILVAKLIRDTDKLDIYRVILDFYNNDETNPDGAFFERELVSEQSCSPMLIDALLNNRRVDYRELKTIYDMRLLQLTWVFDVNFTETLVKIRRRRLLERIIALLPKTEDITRAGDYVLGYLNRRIAGEKS